ncbi:hypothetical protein [Hyphomicrobium sp. 99]|uniref:hypothetical protein n=1 Tax=Hyphomicrobium sp. 99 TaxID=1163419 RepID=UPI0005F83C69|nr:hypothetical protein [Hyphomicrobium sp. 99]
MTTAANISGYLDVGGYVVVGFFTPNYRPLADDFAASLSRHAIPHMLYAWESGTWHATTLAKPLVTQRAMEDFPDRTIVLMDVDIDVHGPITPALEFAGDISLWIGVGVHAKNEPGWRIRAISSSRLVIWRQTEKAKRLLRTWCQLTAQQIPDHILDDEQTLTLAIEHNDGLTVTTTPRRYAARNPWEVSDDAIIVHKTISREMPSRQFLPRA